MNVAVLIVDDDGERTVLAFETVSQAWRRASAIALEMASELIAPDDIIKEMGEHVDRGDHEDACRTLEGWVDEGTMFAVDDLKLNGEQDVPLAKGPTSKHILSLEGHVLTVVVNGDTGQITRESRAVLDEDDEATLIWDVVESIVLAHAVGGINIANPAYVGGLRDALAATTVRPATPAPAEVVDPGMRLKDRIDQALAAGSQVWWTDAFETLHRVVGTHPGDPEWTVDSHPHLEPGPTAFFDGTGRVALDNCEPDQFIIGERMSS